MNYKDPEEHKEMIERKKAELGGLLVGIDPASSEYEEALREMYPQKAGECAHYGCGYWCDGCVLSKKPRTCGIPGDQNVGQKG